MDRVVLDTVVFVRALINPHNRSGRLLSGCADRYTLLISKPTARELLEVLRRPELKRKFTTLAHMNIRRVIDLVAQAHFVEIGEVPPIVRDPKDDIIAATAIAGLADFIVSEDKDLLDLKKVSGIPIINTQAFLAHLEGLGDE